mmetsp:Transcript_38838/g.64608  ORF Transcript_38838/g.64608 Transcript_38838/m.64608 type:complete len:454 (+) Transcript_38838:37-1398(+)
MLTNIRVILIFSILALARRGTVFAVRTASITATNTSAAFSKTERREPSQYGANLLSPTRRPTATPLLCPSHIDGSLTDRLWPGVMSINMCLLPFNAQLICGRLCRRAATLDFVAPNNAVYSLSTYHPFGPGFSFNTIRVQDASTCRVLGCLDAKQSTNTVSLKVPLRAGQRMFVTVGSYNGTCPGDYATLSIIEYKYTGCVPDPAWMFIAHGLEPLSINLGANYEIGSMCSPPYDPTYTVCGRTYSVDSPVVRYFTAPENGSYIFESRSVVPMILSVRTEAGRGCLLFGCDADNFAINHTARVIAKLSRGQQASVVGGRAGPQCSDISLEVTKSIGQCRVNSDCLGIRLTAPRPTPAPAFNYTCISNTCVPKECLTSDDCTNYRSCESNRCTRCRYCFNNSIGIDACLSRRACCIRFGRYPSWRPWCCDLNPNQCKASDGLKCSPTTGTCLPL